MLSRAVMRTRGVLPLTRPGNCLQLHRDGSGGPVASRSRFLHPEGMVPFEEDFSETPEYPSIDPEVHDWNEHRRKRRQAALDFHKRIQQQPNVEAKTFEINLPRHYGYVATLLTEDIFDYDSQSAYKYITRTHLESDTQLPDFYSAPDLAEKAKYFAEKVKGPLLDALKLEMEGTRHSFEDDLGLNVHTIDLKKTQSCINQINRVILSVLGSEVDHLRQCQVDYSPNVEAFWFAGGQQPSPSIRAKRKGKIDQKGPEWCKPRVKEDDPIERNVQYRGSPVLQLRCEHPIQHYVDETSELCKKSEEFPDVYQYNLKAFGIHTEFRYSSFLTGSWSGDSNQCSHVAFHPRHHLLQDVRRSSKYWVEDTEEALASQAILASFGRLVAQSMYFGFDQFSDLNYPFSTQTVITDGLNWSFFVYQLNTFKLGQMHLAANQKQNVCWGTKSMSIFDSTDSNKLNDDVLQTLLKFYLNPPVPISAENPKPYITAPISDWNDDIQREIVYHNYKDMVSQRWYRSDGMLGRQMPEIYDWERIYKIKFKMRPLDPRRRFFELPPESPEQNPYNRVYKLVDPRKIRRGLRLQMEKVAARKEAERLEAAKLADASKYAGGYGEENP